MDTNQGQYSGNLFGSQKMKSSDQHKLSTLSVSTINEMKNKKGIDH